MIHADVTVVIPCYNAERWVGRAIRSALDQGGVAVEVIVVDDGSTDASLDVIKTFGDRLRWETGPNRGACAARNRGLALATAPYVMFLDADDYLEGPFLAHAVDRLGYAQADIGFGPLIGERGAVRRPYRPRALRGHLDAIAMLCEDHFITPCATVWCRTFLQGIGGWRHGLRRYQDLDVVFRALARRPTVVSWTQGAGVSFQHALPRISHQTDVMTVADQVEVVRDLAEHLSTAGVERATAQRYVRVKAYQLCRMMARASDPRAYELALNAWRELGGRGHLGPWTHVMGASILGLRTKERVALRFARRRRRGAMVPARPS